MYQLLAKYSYNGIIQVVRILRKCRVLLQCRFSGLTRCTTCVVRADGTSMWSRLQEAERESLVAEISDLVQRQLVTSTLQSERRDRLERNLRVSFSLLPASRHELLSQKRLIITVETTHGIVTRDIFSSTCFILNVSKPVTCSSLISYRHMSCTSLL